MDTNATVMAQEQNHITEVRPIEVITTEILLFKQQAGAAILEIGKRLIEAKEQLQHGEWLPWLEEQVEFSEATAQRFMRLAKEYSNPSPVTDLGVSKALVLLALPASERDEFVGEKHMVNGEEKSVSEMSKRELEKVIRERDEARADADYAQQRVKGLNAKLEEAKQHAAREQQEAFELVQALKLELEELRAAPKEVAVETVVDETAINAAKTAAREEAERKLKSKIEKAEKAQAAAEQAKAKAEQDIAALKVAQEQSAAIVEREKQAMADQVADLQKKLAMASSSEMTIFKLHFEQGQESINKMTECIGRMAEARDLDGAVKLKNALSALLTSTLEVLK